MRSADHMGFVVPDLDEAVSFFVEVLGAEEVFRIAPISDPNGDSMTRKVGVHPRATVRGAMLRFGPATNVEPHAGLVNLFCTTSWGMLIELVHYRDLPYERDTSARIWGPAAVWSNR